MKNAVLKIFSLGLIAFTPTIVKAGPMQNGSAFDFEFTSIDGKPMPLNAYKGKVLLVVNTASFCGFTKQYGGLQALYEKYEPQGLVVVGVPSNDFGGQEPGDAGKIKEFCSGTFGITFPMTDKYPVTGANAHPFYQWAVKTLGDKAAPGWNFHKYVIGRDGKLIASFQSGTAPDGKELLAALDLELAKSSN